MDECSATTASRPGKAILYVLLFFRYAVQSSVAIACYCLCYLAYEHNTHVCNYWAYTCTEKQKQNGKVPWQLILFITTCVIATLESMTSAFHSLHAFRRPSYKQLLCSTTPVTVFYLISYISFWRMPTVIIWCPPGPNEYRDLWSAPETYDCCITIGAIIAGGIGLVFQTSLTIVATVGVVKPKIGDKRIRLPMTSSTKCIGETGMGGDIRKEKDLV